MRPFWHPLSTLFIVDPWCLATPTLMRMLLRTGDLALRYAGDRMAPAIAHGDEVVARLPDGELRAGEVVVALHAGVVDLLRVAEVTGDRVRLIADADANVTVELESAAIVARTGQPRRAPAARLTRRLRRLALDLREARDARPDSSEPDGDGGVLAKYDYQAPFYQAAAGPDIADDLLNWIRSRVPEGLRLLVVGSGSGRECMALRAAGWPVEGVDFAPAMVRLAQEEAARRKLDITFRSADIRTLRQPPGHFGAIVFTYDVYSFLPGRSRVATLQRMREWMSCAGALFLSARRRTSLYDRAIVGLQGRRGDSHTRWIAADGSLRRSFVHLFTDRELGREVRAAGFRPVERRGGHLLLRSR